jgi:hypothetical protein
MKPSARRLLAPVLGLLVAATANAQPFETPPPPAAPRPLTIAAPVEQALANGLRVIVATREGVPLVTAMLVVLSRQRARPAAARRPRLDDREPADAGHAPAYRAADRGRGRGARRLA